MTENQIHGSPRLQHVSGSVFRRLLERNRQFMPLDGWGQQCWYIEQLLQSGLINRLDTVLHIGSGAYNPERMFGNSYKPLFDKYGHRGRILGVDAVAGENVDVVIDWSGSYEALAKELDDRYDIVICTSMLEHDREPTQTIKHIAAMLNPDGMAIFTAPSTRRAHGNKGVYGNYQNLLPDFFYYHCRGNGLRIVEGSFVYTVSTGDVYQVDGVNHHENMIYEKGEDELYHGIVDRRNIPWISSLPNNLRSYPFPRNLLARVMARILRKVSPDFANIMRHPVYFDSQMALCCIKGEARPI